MADAIERVAWLYLLNKARESRRLPPYQTIQRRSEFGEFHHLLQELRAFSSVPAQFDNVLTRIGARISYQDTNYRRLISAEERLSIYFPTQASDALDARNACQRFETLETRQDAPRWTRETRRRTSRRSKRRVHIDFA
ncbi:hypothetical protein CRENBAI_006742 [Crenichthys baileyi]|uniref:Uncharacterized protein n=1 Tax=Crenichthys baileyi TaxID=28760 RepID=A0AAV9RG64_9TELE